MPPRAAFAPVDAPIDGDHRRAPSARDCRGGRRARPELRRPRQARQRLGPPAAGAGRRPRRHRGDLPAPLSGNVYGAPGHVQGRGRLRAPRSDPSCRARARDAGRGPARGLADDARVGPGAWRHGPRCPRAQRRRPARRSAARSNEWGKPGLCDLHLRLHRQAQRRCLAPCRPVQFDSLAPPRLPGQPSRPRRDPGRPSL